MKSIFGSAPLLPLGMYVLLEEDYDAEQNKMWSCVIRTQRKPNPRALTTTRVKESKTQANQSPRPDDDTREGITDAG